jgi:hypothetical protein
MAIRLSNKTIIILTVLARIVSIGGMLLSIKKLNRLESATSITGYDLYTATAGVNVTISSSTAIIFTTKYVDFGTGVVNGSCGYCNMYTKNHSEGYLGDCCQDFTAPSSGLILENIGNTNVSVMMNSSVNAVDLIGGTSAPGPQFRMKIIENETYSCANVTYGPASGMNETWNNTFADVPTTNTEVCARFRPDITNDELRIDINVTIPDNSFTGIRAATLSATATSRTD